MERKKNNMVKQNLPHEIIEIILSRSPAKSLFRFKCVCKRWNATISDPRFLETHVLQSNTSPSSFLLSQLQSQVFMRVELKGNDFLHLSAMEDPPVKLSMDYIWCHCDGLIFLSHRDIYGHKNCVLWNPSTGTFRYLRCPDPVLHYSLIGICYDPLLKDYKVVVRNKHRYAVYYCKTNSWIVKEEADFSDSYNINVPYHNGIPFEGSIYWINSPGKNSGDEILCFDGRDEQFKILPGIDRLKDVKNWVNLVSCVKGLYLFPYYGSCPLTDEILVMKKVGDSWKEVTVHLPYSSSCVIPLCWSSENKIIFRVHPQGLYLLCDVNKRSCVEIQNSLGLTSCRLVPYVENMLLL